MTPKSKPEIVSLAEFTQEVDGALLLASDPNNKLTDTLMAANNVVVRLAAVEVGRVVVQPPLSHEQVVHYKSKAETILAVGQQAISSLERIESKGRFASSFR